MREKAYTVADPRTVVIHFHYTAVASTAVVGPRRLQLVASLAVLELIELFS